MIKLACLCGEVGIAVPERPDFIHECNCTLCRKSGARWSYFDPATVTVEGATASYSREDKGDPSARVHFCPRCGVTTHFRLTPGVVAKFGDTMMGVNMWLAQPHDLDGVELRFPDGASWAGEGAFGYVRPARIIGADPG